MPLYHSPYTSSPLFLIPSRENQTTTRIRRLLTITINILLVRRRPGPHAEPLSCALSCGTHGPVVPKHLGSACGPVALSAPEGGGLCCDAPVGALAALPPLRDVTPVEAKYLYFLFNYGNYRYPRIPNKYEQGAVSPLAKSPPHL